MSEQQDERKGHAHLYYENKVGTADSFESRWDELRRIADFRPTDRVLDVGCAEGLVALEVAPLVAHVHGFDISTGRIEHAVQFAEERGIGNATFEVASIDEVALEPESWDVTLFLAVWGKRTLDGSRAIGEPELTRLLAATRRQLVARVGLQRDEPREANLLEILDVCDDNEFDGLGFNRPLHEGTFLRGNILIANRRGSDARSGELPPVALVPTSRLADHPVVAGAESIRAPQGE
jgi:SAM-dependent methyltransferase